MLASIEFFVFLVIAGATALFNWFQKRKQEPEDWAGQQPSRRDRDRKPARSLPPPIPQSQPAKKTTNWEEELRRMLEGTVPTTKNPPPPPIVIEERKAPPPVPRQSAPPRAEPSTRSLPKTFDQKYYKAHCNYCDEHIEFPSSAMDEVISCPHCHRPTVLRPFQETRVETLAHQPDLSSFATAIRKYDAASNLSERVAAHMHAAGHQAVGLTSIESTKTLWPEVAETKALFKNAKTVRQAVIASLILGPPKALENQIS